MRDLLERIQELSEGPDLPDRGSSKEHIKKIKAEVDNVNKERKAVLKALGGYQDAVGDLAYYANWIGESEGDDVPEKARKEALWLAVAADGLEDWIVNEAIPYVEKGKGEVYPLPGSEGTPWQKYLPKLLNALKYGK